MQTLKIKSDIVNLNNEERKKLHNHIKILFENYFFPFSRFNDNIELEIVHSDSQIDSFDDIAELGESAYLFKVADYYEDDNDAYNVIKAYINFDDSFKPRLTNNIIGLIASILGNQEIDAHFKSDNFIDQDLDILNAVILNLYKYDLLYLYNKDILSIEIGDNELKLGGSIGEQLVCTYERAWDIIEALTFLYAAKKYITDVWPDEVSIPSKIYELYTVIDDIDKSIKSDIDIHEGNLNKLNTIIEDLSNFLDKIDGENNRWLNSI